MKPAIRHAEAERVSSCSFADAIAQKSIEAYRSICPISLQQTYEQTVLAAFLIDNVDFTVSDRFKIPLTTVSFGVGTKFLPWDLLVGERTCSPRQRSRIKDCHAEILAKKGLHRYLLKECKRAVLSTLIESIEPSLVVELLLDRSFALKDGVRLHFYSSSSPCGNGSIKKWAKGKKPPIYPHLPLHAYPEETHSRLYVTARDEGQVAILVKRSLRALDADDKLSNHIELPASNLAVPEPSIHTKGYIDTTRSSLGSHPKSSQDSCPVGTAPVNSHCGLIMTCSDKIAKWNAIGVQGGLLSTLFKHPLYISTCTIGRKYSKPILQRALCCRLQDFKYPFVGTRVFSDSSDMSSDIKMKVSYATHHPVMLSTSVKFDDSVIKTGAVATGDLGAKESFGASFSQPLCLVWAIDTIHNGILHSGFELSTLDVIDSCTGYIFVRSDEEAGAASEGEVSVSQYCGYEIYKLYKEIGVLKDKINDESIDTSATSAKTVETICTSDGSNHNDSLILQLAVSYSIWKRNAQISHPYFLAKEVLLKDPKFFSGWISNDISSDLDVEHSRG